MEEEEFQPLFKKYTKQFFDDESQILRLREHLSDESLEKLKRLGEKMGEPYVLRLGAFLNNEFVGWHFGFQESALKFYMCNSGVLPEFRRKGVYSALLQKTIELVEEEGFQEIYSRHSPPNNDVIIPKLQAGFVISSMEISDVFGSLIHLTYFPEALRRKVFSYRTGHTKPDQQIRDALGV